MEEFVTEVGLRLAYILLFLSVCTALFFVIRTLTANIKQAAVVFGLDMVLILTALGTENYALLIWGAAVTYIILVYSAIKQKNTSAYVSLGGVLVMFVVFLIGYSSASDEVTAKAASLGVTAAQSKMIGGMISTGISLFVIAAVTAFVGSIYTMIKR